MRILFEEPIVNYSPVTKSAKL